MLWADSKIPRSMVRVISAALAWPSVVPFRIANCQILRLAYSAVQNGELDVESFRVSGGCALQPAVFARTAHANDHLGGDDRARGDQDRSPAAAQPYQD